MDNVTMRQNWAYWRGELENLWKQLQALELPEFFDDPFCCNGQDLKIMTDGYVSWNKVTLDYPTEDETDIPPFALAWFAALNRPDQKGAPERHLGLQLRLGRHVRRWRSRLVGVRRMQQGLEDPRGLGVEFMITDPDDAEQLREVLDDIHDVLVHPYEWEAETIERVASVMYRAGYSSPPPEDYDEDGELIVDVDRFRPWCPATGAAHVWTDDAGEITARYGVSVYCDECHQSPSKQQIKEWNDAVGD